MQRPARALMLQGTGSNVGKSLLVAGLCRVARNRGLKVLPFKPQNMSSQATRLSDGELIGSAQALQAQACGVTPRSEMNPVLLMPRSDTGAQVLVRGRLWRETEAGSYGALKRQLAGVVQESFAALRAEADLVLVEGAGSPAEVNLREDDIANMGFARADDVPVVLVGDIDRGGIIAQIVGTQAVLDPADAALIRGFVVNRFRGDPALFESGYRMIAERTGWPGYGVVPWFADAALLPAEDSQSLAAASRHPRLPRNRTAARIVCLLPSRPIGLDRLEPLRTEPAVEWLVTRPEQPLPEGIDAVIVPDSGHGPGDPNLPGQMGLAADLVAQCRRGGRLFGVGRGVELARRIIAPLLEQGPQGALPHDPVEALPADIDFGEDAFRVEWLKTLGQAVGTSSHAQRIEQVIDALARHLEMHLDTDGLLALAR